MEKKKSAKRSSIAGLLQTGISISMMIITTLSLNASTGPGERDTVSVKNHSAFVERGKAKISWQSQRFIKEGFYILEKSPDNRTFMILHKIEATKIDSVYMFEDTRPFKGTNYYRLRYCDKEAKSSILHTFRLNNYPNAIPDFKVYTDDNVDKIQVEFTDIKQPLVGSICIKDVKGNIICNKKIDISAAHSLKVILNENIPVGIYDVLIANDEGYKKNQWIVIKD